MNYYHSIQTAMFEFIYSPYILKPLLSPSTIPILHRHIERIHLNNSENTLFNLLHQNFFNNLSAWEFIVKKNVLIQWNKICRIPRTLYTHKNRCVSNIMVFNSVEPINLSRPHLKMSNTFLNLNEYIIKGKKRFIALTMLGHPTCILRIKAEWCAVKHAVDLTPHTHTRTYTGNWEV